MCLKAHAVILDAQREPVSFDRQRDGQRLGVGMMKRIRQGLLRDAVERLLDGGGEWGEGTGQGELQLGVGPCGVLLGQLAECQQQSQILQRRGPQRFQRAPGLLQSGACRL